MGDGSLRRRMAKNHEKLFSFIVLLFVLLSGFLRKNFYSYDRLTLCKLVFVRNNSHRFTPPPPLPIIYHFFSSLIDRLFFFIFFTFFLIFLRNFSSWFLIFFLCIFPVRPTLFILSTFLWQPDLRHFDFFCFFLPQHFFFQFLYYNILKYFYFVKPRLKNLC